LQKDITILPWCFKRWY